MRGVPGRAARLDGIIVAPRALRLRLLRVLARSHLVAAVVTHVANAKRLHYHLLPDAGALVVAPTAIIGGQAHGVIPLVILGIPVSITPRPSHPAAHGCPPPPGR